MTPGADGKPASLPDYQVRLAAERTLLAWIRTGLALMGFGFVVARLGFFLRELSSRSDAAAQPRSELSLWLGTALVLLGVAVNAAAALRYRSFSRRLDRGESLPATGSIGLIVSSILALIGVGIAAYLISLGG